MHELSDHILSAQEYQGFAPGVLPIMKEILQARLGAQYRSYFQDFLTNTDKNVIAARDGFIQAVKQSIKDNQLSSAATAITPPHGAKPLTSKDNKKFSQFSQDVQAAYEALLSACDMSLINLGAKLKQSQWIDGIHVAEIISTYTQDKNTKVYLQRQVIENETENLAQLLDEAHRRYQASPSAFSRMCMPIMLAGNHWGTLVIDFEKKQMVIVEPFAQDAGAYKANIERYKSAAQDVLKGFEIRESAIKLQGDGSSCGYIAGRMAAYLATTELDLFDAIQKDNVRKNIPYFPLTPEKKELFIQELTEKHIRHIPIQESRFLIINNILEELKLAEPKSSHVSNSLRFVIDTAQRSYLNLIATHRDPKIDEAYKKFIAAVRGTCDRLLLNTYKVDMKQFSDEMYAAYQTLLATCDPLLLKKAHETKIMPQHGSPIEAINIAQVNKIFTDAGYKLEATTQKHRYKDQNDEVFCELDEPTCELKACQRVDSDEKAKLLLLGAKAAFGNDITIFCLDEAEQKRFESLKAEVGINIRIVKDEAEFKQYQAATIERLRSASSMKPRI